MPRQGPGMSGPRPKAKPAQSTYKLGPQAAGGAVLRRGSFQPENQKQQAELRQGVQVNAQQQAHIRKQKLAHAFALELYKHGHRVEALKLERKVGLEPSHVPTHILPGEKLPVLGQLLSSVDPVVLGRTAVYNLTHKPWDTARRAPTRIAGVAPIAGTAFPGRGGLPEEPIVPPEAGALPEDIAAQTVRESLGPARARRAAQKGLYREERGKRIAAARAASERAGGGEAGFAAAKEQLRGELPKVKFENLREGKLTQDHFESLLTQVQNHPDLGWWEKIHAQQGLADAFREGKTPQPSQIKHFETVFGQDAANEIAKTSKLVKAGRVAMGVLNMPRSVMASFDLSAPFRQGLVAGVSHPGIFFKNFAPMVKAAGSENYYRALMDHIESRPNIDLYHRSGLKLTDLSRDTGQREEQFPVSYAEKIPGAGIGIRASGRAYTAFLNKMRVDMFDHLMEHARKQGVNVEDRKFQKGIATYINSATGRGSLGPIEHMGPALNTVFFSPRLMASRLNFMDPTWYARLDPYARRQALKSVGKMAAFGAGAGAAGAAAGGKIGTDPRSSDFGKIRFGHTRLDPLGGFSQYVVAGSRIASGKSISSITGQVSRLGPGMGQLSRKDIAERFFAGKAAPGISFIYDVLNGKDFQGQPLSIKNEVLNRVIPLALQDANSLYQDKRNIPLAAAGYAATGLGIGLQTYGPHQLAKGIQQQGRDLPKALMDAAKKAGLKGATITPELKREIKVYTTREAAYAKLREQKGHLTPADRFVSDVNLLVKNGIGTSAQAAEAAKWAQTAPPSELKKAHSALSRRYFSFTNLNHVVTVLGDHGQKVKLPFGG